jgi:choline dehydrogenase-like flavoprotein
MNDASGHYSAVVIGSGFGGTLTALPLARAFKERGKGERLLMLERGTWWTTPVETVQDKRVAALKFLQDQGEPVQCWSSAENFRGFLDIFTRCVRRKRNPDGLYDLTNFGRYAPFRLGLMSNDGVTILRASGVGGGSLVYANVTIRPPDFVFDYPRWPLSWTPAERHDYYELARDAIGYGVLWTLNDRQTKQDPSFQPVVQAGQVNTGLANIVTRSARLNPRWVDKADPNNPRGIKQIDPAHSAPKAAPPDIYNNLWIDRARIFQSVMGLPAEDGSGPLTTDFGTVDSSINDVNPESGPFDPKGQPKNYCERQGRCIVGCLPGARHTLNKQLMAAVLGAPPSRIFPQGLPAQLEGVMRLEALAEVDTIKASTESRPSYEIRYFKRDKDNPTDGDWKTVSADRVIVAAGCVGTTEILLRSKANGGLPGLSEKLGSAFSTNGDYLAFLNETSERINLSRGPVTTSFAHFNTPEAGPGGGDPARFVTIEDNGIPRALSALAGQGVPLFKSLSKGRHTRLFIWWAVGLFVLRRFLGFLPALFRNYRQRGARSGSEDEFTANMMCVAAMGRESAIGRFRLGGFGDTTLRVGREDGSKFTDDEIYDEIRKRLNQFAERLTDKADNRFINPFVGAPAEAFNAKSIGLSHPLGGCPMATSARDGVCDEFGRVFDESSGDSVYAGLYIADAARIPTALGVNPSLTISALALRTANKLIDEVRAPAATGAEQATAGGSAASG